MVSGQELGGDSGKIDLILCDQIVIKHSREKKESEVKLRQGTIVWCITEYGSGEGGRDTCDSNTTDERSSEPIS
mgnify:CR=1 FL=1